ncbi:MAG: 16S rRNA (cytosine(1402)-N(4))-methyltransferase RsmH [Patescibacteria group bacterium]
MEYNHIPVMLSEVMEALNPKTGGVFIDCTLGGAGYTMALAKKVGSKGKILGIDLDKNALKNAKNKIKDSKLENIVLVQGNFKNLKEIISKSFGAKQKFDGIVFDLGLSSFQLDDENRGFSFKGERPLDMSFGSKSENDTVQIINNYSLLELTRIFREYGEEKMAYQIAKAIVEARKNKKIEKTSDLVHIIEDKIPLRFRTKIHPATRIFQALRMETNTELKNLAEVLPQAVELLKKSGKIAVVSFHSGEDRIVKWFFKGDEHIKILTKKPLIPCAQESAENPRSRSAKLRIAEKIV